MKISELLHESLVGEGVNDPHIFKAIAIIGPMGAGKSTIAQQLVGGSGLRTLNIDSFNDLLIKKGEVPTGILTPDQLERNWELTVKQRTNWLNDRLGILIDRSGRHLNGIIQALTTLENLGYDTMIIFVNVSLETSITRQRTRVSGQQSKFGQGRRIPLSLAKASYNQIQQNIPKLQQMYGDKLLVIDNEDAVDLSQEKKIVDRFLSSPPSNPKAVAWIKSKNQLQGQRVEKQIAQQQRKTASAARAAQYQQPKE